MNNKGRMSLIEIIALLCIGVEVVFLVGSAYGWLDIHMSSGNDGGYVNTCESVAKVNSLNGVNCPVNNCGNSDGSCVHHTSQGYIGYFDSVSNTIVASKPKGYNSSANPSVNGKSYVGEVGKMVLEVRVNNGNIDIWWTGGSE